MTKNLELYYCPTPNGWKISIMLEELGEAYDVKYIDIRVGEQFAPSFLEISPNNRIPAIVDYDTHDGAPISVFESGAILLYLARKHGKLYPSDLRKQVATEEWLFWQVGGLGPMAGQAHHFRIFAPETIEYGIKRYSEETSRLYRVMDKRLDQVEYLAGDEYSVADIACVGWASSWQKQGHDIDTTPNFRRWLEQVSQRPAVQAGLNLGADLLKTD